MGIGPEKRVSPGPSLGAWRAFALVGAALLAVTILALYWLGVGTAGAAPTSYQDRGVTVTFPQGDDSFADQLVSLNRNGDTAATNGNGSQSLGPPNDPPDVIAPTNSTSIGDGGSLTLHWTNNVLTGSGSPSSDLHIFEKGTQTEVADVYVATGSAASCPAADDPSWTLVGRTTTTSGGIDIDDNGFGTSARLFCVRVVDVADDQPNAGDGVVGGNGGPYDGADIDAVGAIETILLNDAPANTVPGAQTTAENTNRVFNSANGNQISISDVDAGSSPVRVTLTATNGTLTLGGTTGLTFTAGDGTNDATMTFTGTIANINTALDGLTFRPNTNYAGPASLQITTNDQGNTGDGGPKEDTDTVSITVTPGNNVPVITTSPGITNYTSGDPATIIDSGATVTDEDSPNFGTGNLTVRIASGVTSDDRLAIRSQPSPGSTDIFVSGNTVYYGGTGNNNRIGTFTGGTGNTDLVINFDINNTRPTLAAAQALVRNITYSNVGSFSGSRVVRFVINDGDGGTSDPAYKRISNVAPSTGNLNGDSVTFTEGGSAVRLDSGGNATVGDSDSADFDTGNVTVSITTNRVAGEDVLGVRNEGTAAGEIGVSGSTITYGGTAIGTSSGGTGTNDLVITLNSSATPAAVQALVRNLTYGNGNNADPSTSARTVRVTINDGDGGTSTPADVTVNVTPVNDPPTLSATGNSPTFTEGGSAVDLFGGVSVSTAESGQNIDRLTLTVTNVSGGASEILRIDGTDVALTDGNTLTTSTNAMSISISASGGTATVTISKAGGISAANMATLIDGMTYRHTGDDPGSASRVVTLTSVRDTGGTSNGGSDTTSLNISSTVSITPVNDAPQIALPGGALSYTENDNPKVIDSGATATDVDSANFDTGKLTVDFSAGGTADDRLAIRDEGAGSDQIGVSGSNVTYGGVVIGTVAGGDGTTPLVVTFNASSSPAAAQALMRNITYADVSDTPSTSPRTVRFVLTDGDGGTSDPATKTINVTATNDAPTITNITDQTILEDTDTGDLTFTISDPDNPVGELTLSGGSSDTTLVPDDNITFGGTNASRTVRVTPATNRFGGPVTISVTVSDGIGPGSQSATDTFELTVDPVNDEPSFTVPANAPAVDEDAGPQTVANFADPITAGPFETGQTVSFIVTNNTNPALFTGGGQPAISQNGTLTYTPAANKNGTAAITVKATDDGNTGAPGDDNESAEQTFTITVTLVNSKPTANDGTEEMDEDGAPITIDFGALVSDVETSDANLIYNVADPDPAEGGLSGTGSTRSFDSAVDFNGTVDITYTVTDRGDPDDCTGAPSDTCAAAKTSDQKTVTVTVHAVNDEPSFDLPSSPDQTVDEDSPAQTVPGFATNISKGTDNESAQILAFDVTNDNNGLFDVQPAIDPTTGDLTYTPEANAFGEATVSVKLEDDGGTDRGGDDVSPVQTFKITVTSVNDPPTVSFTNPNVEAQTFNESGTATHLYEYVVDNTDGPPATVNESCGDAPAVEMPDEPGDPATGSFRCKFPDGTALHTVSVTANDGEPENNSDRDEIEVTVTNVDPEVTGLAGQNASEGVSTSFDLGTFTDPGADGPWSATVDWGDGDTETITGSPFNAPGSLGSMFHTYADSGSYAVTVRVKEEGTGTPPFDEGAFTANVANAAPAVTAGADQTSDEGEDTSFDLGSFTDPGTDGAWSVTVDWGDGKPNTTFTVPESSRDPDGETFDLGSRNHAYADNDSDQGDPDNDSYTVTVTVTEKGTGTPPSGSDAFQVTVNNVKPTVQLFGPTEVFESTTTEREYTFTVTDPGDDGFTVVSGFPTCGANGDLVSGSLATDANGGSFECIFEDGPATSDVAIRVEDDDGATDTDDQPVKVVTQVDNDDPTISSVTSETPVDEGEASTITVNATDPAGTNDPLSYEFDCNGDGDYADAGADKGPQAQNTAQCAFDDGDADGTDYTVNVRVTDGDGGADTDSTTVTVNNVTPTATLSNDGPRTVGSAVTISFSDQDDASDPDEQAGLRYEYRCDGSSFTGPPDYATASTNATTTCTFPDSGTYTVRARIIDRDGGASVYTTDVTVQEPPVLSIDDVTVAEGNAPDTTTAIFTVTRTGNLRDQSAVRFATADGSATQPGDYAQNDGTITFAPGQETSTVTVTVKGDALDEANETFFVDLTSATNATIGEAQGVGTITDDDPTPSLSINDVTVAEGDSGTTNATFTVSLSAASGRQVTVAFATADGTAQAPSDYTSTSGTLTFAPGETTKSVVVPVEGDTLDETNEQFFVNLSSATNATIGEAQGVGTITDDDDSPQANDDGSAANPITLLEDDPNGVTTNVLANDTGLGDAPLTVQVTTPPGKGTATVNPDKTITYKPNPDENGPDSYRYTVTDSDGQTSTATVYLQITPVNDAPVVDLNGGEPGTGYTATFTEDGGPKPIVDKDALTVTDVDDADIESATVTLTNDPDAAAESLSVDLTGTTGITATAYDSNTGKLVLSGTATKADYQKVLRTVTYNNTSQNPDTTDRSVTFVVNDGTANSDPATSTVKVNATNDAPQIALPGGALGYTENENPKAIDSGATAADVDSANFDTGKLTVDFSAGGTADDRLAIRDEGAGSDQIGVSGSSVTYGNTTIGTVAGGMGTTPLVVTFNASSSPAAAQALMRNITYADVSDAPSTSPRTVRFVLTDGDGGTSDPATKQINVNATNDAPVARNDAYGTDEDAKQTVNPPGVLGNDADAENGSLTAQRLTYPAHGMLDLNADGSFDYTPDANYNGTDSFIYRACEAGGGPCSDPATVNITIAAVNDAPIADDDAATTDDDTPVNIDVKGNDAPGPSNESGQSLTVTNVTDPPHGAAQVVAAGPDAGKVRYTPDASFNGTDSFEYTVCDDGTPSECDTATVTVTVRAVDDAPTITSVENDGPIGEGSPARITVTASDPDTPSGSLSYEFDCDDDGNFEVGPQAANAADCTFPDNGIKRVNVRVTDGAGGSDTGFTDVTVNNVAPTADAQSVTTAEDTSNTITLTGNDPGSDPLVFKVTTLPAKGKLYEGAGTSGHGITGGDLPYTLSGNQVTYVPDPDFNGSDGFDFKVNDGAVGSAAATVSIEVTPVNDPPVASDDAYSTDEAQTLTVPAPGVLTNDTDVEDSSLTAQRLTNPANGTLDFNVDGSFTYAPNADFNGTDSFTYKACKAGGEPCSDPATVTITVRALDDAPTISDILDQSTDEDTPTGDINFTVGDAETPTGGLTVTGSSSNTTLVPNSNITFGGSGANRTVRITPAANRSGTATITVSVSDGTHTTTDTFVLTVSPVVNPVNDAPTASATPSSLSIDEDADAQTVGLSGTDVETGASDLRFTITQSPAHGELKKDATVLTTGATFTGSPADVTYKPNPDFNGPDSFKFKVTDRGDPDNCGTPSTSCAASKDSDVVTVPITVNAGSDNAAPTADAQAVSTTEDTSKTITLSGTDADGNNLTYKVTALPAKGKLYKGNSTNPSDEITSAGTTLSGNQITYKPNADFNGSDSFKFRVNNGNADSNEATITVDVTPVNDPPSFKKGPNQSVAEDAGPRTVPNWATDISKGPQNESTQTVQFLVTTNNNALFTAGGRPSISPNGTLTYTPAPNAFGTATVTVRAKDSGGTASGGQDTSASQTFTITVTPVDDPPGTCAQPEPGKKVIRGRSGNDVLRGTQGDDVIYGGSGSDKIYGLGGNDVLCGESGSDQIDGGPGNDHLNGASGNDTLTGGPGDDTFVGGSGKNKIRQ
jgi:hypothetical protein